jgi:hypothetical protein
MDRRCNCTNKVSGGLVGWWHVDVGGVVRNQRVWAVGAFVVMSVM